MYVVFTRIDLESRGYEEKNANASMLTERNFQSRIKYLFLCFFFVFS